jgi:hypothetical protein
MESYATTTPQAITFLPTHCHLGISKVSVTVWRSIRHIIQKPKRDSHIPCFKAVAFKKRLSRGDEV